MAKFFVKFQSLTLGLQEKLDNLSIVRAVGIPGVTVKCVEIGKNAKRESTLLGYY